MSTTSDDYRAVSYWPNKDLHLVFTVKRTPETDAMTNDELIQRHKDVINMIEQDERERRLREVDDEQAGPV